LERFTYQFRKEEPRRRWSEFKAKPPTILLPWKEESSRQNEEDEVQIFLKRRERVSGSSTNKEGRRSKVVEG
jgi:hypothetical protein